MKTPKKEPEIIRIRKGLAVGKSTDHASDALKDTPKRDSLTFSLGDKLKEVAVR